MQEAVNRFFSYFLAAFIQKFMEGAVSPCHFMITFVWTVKNALMCL